MCTAISAGTFRLPPQPYRERRPSWSPGAAYFGDRYNERTEEFLKKGTDAGLIPLSRHNGPAFSPREGEVRAIFAFWQGEFCKS